MRQAPVRRDTSESSDVAKLVRLHHRRRGWAWVAIGSTVGLVVYGGIDLNLSGNLTGTAETLSFIPVTVLVALVLVGLVVIIADTSRIHRADAVVRVSARGSVSHYPLYAPVHRYPPQHRGSWVFAIGMLVAMTGITVLLLPSVVDSWAFVVGAENQDTFNPVSYGQACSGLTRGGGCHIVTHGYLSKNGADVTWGSQVPLGQPFSVRDPLWAWGTGRNLTSGDGPAIETIVAGLFFDAVTLLLLYALVVIMRDTPRRPNQRMSAPAGANPGGIRRTAHHPNRQRPAIAPKRVPALNAEITTRPLPDIIRSDKTRNRTRLPRCRRRTRSTISGSHSRPATRLPPRSVRRQAPPACLGS